jgi:hypothetical protein
VTGVVVATDACDEGDGARFVCGNTSGNVDVYALDGGRQVARCACMLITNDGVICVVRLAVVAWRELTSTTCR